ncbi:ABC transporter ATP-binding protein [Streptomyces fildesensis]|uniref:ABC transporter ATP-binding protein n=1 Tax=Streptomyces fildesensis TaxID=375757 RepID=UPI00360F9BB9
MASPRTTPVPASATTAPAGTAGPGPALTGALRHSARHAVTVLACSTASAAAAVALPAVLGRTLDLILAHAAGAGRSIALCLALIAAEVLLDSVVALSGGVMTARSTAWLRRRGTDRLLSLAPHQAAERFPPGDLVARLTGNAAEAGAAPVTAATGLAALLTPIGGLLALALTDWPLAVVFAAGLPVFALLLRAFTRTSSDSVTRYQAVQAELANRLVETLAGARTVAAAGTERRERARILAPLSELNTQGRRMWQVYGRAVASSSILVPLLITAVLALGGLRLAAGHLSVGQLLAATRYAALAAGLGGVLGQLNTLIRSRAAAARTLAILEVPAMRGGHRALPADGPGTLELRAVTVHRAGVPVLRSVDLTVPGGTTMAVVGRSGAGKSTLAAIAGRLADPDNGQVLLDGVPLEETDPAQLRREIGYAFERPTLFGDTIGAALAFGPYTPTGRQIEAAARAADADQFIGRLPGRYACRIQDAPLSGGELQRLGLARAFAHAGRLLILDDATSSLDSVTELHVGRALAHEVMPGTRLLIAHRVSSAARADQVAWIESGRVRAVGTHQQLWREPGYRAVFADPEHDDEPGS